MGIFQDKSTSITKREIILKHFVEKISSNTFDEYDILAFLIYIRESLPKKEFPIIRDFCDMIAHRDRDRGLAMDSITAAIENQYEIAKDRKHIVGYKGINQEKWEKEWSALGTQYDLIIDESLLREISLCILSLAQETEYKDKDGNYGKMVLFQTSDDYLALCTTEGKPHSYFICFFKVGPFEFKKMFPAGRIVEPVETIRIDSTLRLKDTRDYII